MNAQEQAAFSKMDARIKADPEIRAILDANRAQLAATRDKGGAARDFQNRIRDQITNIAKKKGLIPDVGQAVFVNPNHENGQLELHRGWAGLSGWQRAAIIAAAAGTGIGAGMLLAGGAAAAGAAGAGGAATAGGAGAAGTAAGAGLTGATLSTIPVSATALGSGVTAGLAGATTVPVGAGLTGAALTTLPISSTAAAAGIPAGSLATGGGAAASGGGYIQGLINNGAKVSNANGGYGSTISRMLGKQGLEGLSRGLGSVSETMANNRGTELDAMLVADNNKLAFDRNARDNDEHNWRMLQATDYIKNGGMQVTGPTKINSGTMDPSKFGFGPKAASANEKMVASTLEKQLMERMQNPIQMRDYDSKMKAGTGEKLTGWLGAGANIASNFFGK